MLAMEKTADGVHQHGVGGSGVETAGLFERQDPFHPALPLGACRPQRPFAPQDATPQGSLGPIVGRFHTVLDEEDPQGIISRSKRRANRPASSVRS